MRNDASMENPYIVCLSGYSSNLFNCSRITEEQRQEWLRQFIDEEHGDLHDIHKIFLQVQQCGNVIKAERVSGEEWNYPIEYDEPVYVVLQNQNDSSITIKSVYEESYVCDPDVAARSGQVKELKKGERYNFDEIQLDPREVKSIVVYDDLDTQLLKLCFRPKAGDEKDDVSKKPRL